MPTLAKWAQEHPDKPAAVRADTGDCITYAQLDASSNRVAQLLLDRRIKQGDIIGILMANDPRYLEIVWAARRLGLYYMPISTQLTPKEVAYVVGDSGAKVLFVSDHFAEAIAAINALPAPPSMWTVGGTADASRDYEHALARYARYAKLPEAPTGRDFCYSSGTTGRQKGIVHSLLDARTVWEKGGDWTRDFGFGADSVYLSTAPLYHAAPLRFVLRAHAVGGTAVLMNKFDAEGALRAIESFRITHSQWVPTMFFRLLQLPDEIRGRYDLSSHQCAIHAAAPCPVEIKKRIIDWWGPIVWEYYAGSERNGVTAIGTTEWLAHKGSVGKAVLGIVHILADDGNELPPRQVGNVYFDGPQFEYHNDPEKTARSRNARGWSTIGDVGFVDEEGYLYLTDRQAHTIISGGVNIYPAEIENVLSLHPLVRDIGVFGIPNPEFGEEVKAAVELFDPGLAGPQLEAELIDYCRARLAGIKCPRSVDFHLALPRKDNGKLYKNLLKQPYLDRQTPAPAR